MILRKLIKNDVPLIVQLQERIFPDGWSMKMLLEAFETGRFFGYGLFEEDKLVCFTTASIAIDTADVEDVLTDTEFRGKGYAINVLKSVISELKKKNVLKVFLEVRESNVPAIKLYSKLGFSKISVRKSYYSDGENALVMCKEI